MKADKLNIKITICEFYHFQCYKDVNCTFPAPKKKGIFMKKALFILPIAIKHFKPTTVVDSQSYQRFLGLFSIPCVLHF